MHKIHYFEDCNVYPKYHVTLECAASDFPFLQTKDCAINKKEKHKVFTKRPLNVPNRSNERGFLYSDFVFYGMDLF